PNPDSWRVFMMRRNGSDMRPTRCEREESGGANALRATQAAQRIVVDQSSVVPVERLEGARGLPGGADDCQRLIRLFGNGGLDKGGARVFALGRLHGLRSGSQRCMM